MTTHDGARGDVRKRACICPPDAVVANCPAHNDWPTAPEFAHELTDGSEGYRAADEQTREGFLIGWKRVTRQDYLAFTSTLGFGDDVTEPAARPDEMLDAIEQAFSDAHEHIECPILCELCGEMLATTVCPECGGSGANNALSQASMAWSECDLCAGATKIHEGCVERSYAELAANRTDQAERIAQAILAEGARLAAQHHEASEAHGRIKTMAAAFAAVARGVV